MRTEFINPFAELNAEELKNLISETKETVATEIHSKDAKPVFTAANLWSIHNMKRSRTSRRTLFS